MPRRGEKRTGAVPTRRAFATSRPDARTTLGRATARPSTVSAVRMTRAWIPSWPRTPHRRTHLQAVRRPQAIQQTPLPADHQHEVGRATATGQEGMPWIRRRPPLASILRI